VNGVRYQVGRRLHHLGRFIRLNARDLRHLDAAMLRRKVRTLVVHHLRNRAVAIALLPVTLSAAIALRLLRPVVVVRIGTINASRIGHLSMDPEMSAAEKEIGTWLPGRPVFDVWYVWRGAYPVANRQMLAMWRRSLRVWPSWLWHRIDGVSRLLPGGAAHVVPVRKGHPGLPDHLQGDAFGAMQRTRPHVAFTEYEAREARRQLMAAGHDPLARHVCVLVRDPAYQHLVVPGDHSNNDFRDSDVAKFLPAMRWLAEQGMKVYRMGAVVREPLGESNPAIVDYATNGMRTELLDIWLSATCEFFISTGTGLDGVANVFRRTRVFVDLGQLIGLNLSFDTVSIPKLLRHEADGRLLTLRESVDAGALSFVDTADLAIRGLGFRGNTPGEILAVVREVHERRTGSWQPRPDEDDLQQRMLAALPESMKAGGVIGRVGYDFLRSNPWWLD
jgi:putative glycosyltransferase (TIGR04372 family)